MPPALLNLSTRESEGDGSNPLQQLRAEVTSSVCLVCNITWIGVMHPYYPSETCKMQKEGLHTWILDPKHTQQDVLSA